MTNQPRLFFILLSSFILAACTLTAEDPKTVADKYWQYLQTGNTTEAEKLISLNSSRAFLNMSAV